MDMQTLPLGGVAIVGGWDGKQEMRSAKALVFDDSTKGMHWEDLPDLPAPVVNAAVVALSDGSVVVAGADGHLGCSLRTNLRHHSPYGHGVRRWAPWVRGSA